MLLDDATSQHVYIHGHTAPPEIGHKAINAVKVPRYGHQRDTEACSIPAPFSPQLDGLIRAKAKDMSNRDGRNMIWLTRFHSVHFQTILCPDATKSK
jgi:hypothetical protein